MSSRKIFGQFVFLILVLLSAGAGALGGLVFVYSSDLPKVRELEDYRPDVMTEIYADDGTAIGSFALEHRVIVTYNQIPPALRNAVIAIEDRHFESHWGVDILGIIRAAGKDLLEWRKTQGASTLTQQLSRMLFLTPDKSFRRKIQEMLLAIQIERYFTKSQIFTMYANQVDLGHGNFGFEAAAQFYFGKHLNELTLPEAATLAGIPRSPTAYSPIVHPELARRRRNQVLLAMLRNGKNQFHPASRRHGGSPRIEHPALELHGCSLLCGRGPAVSGEEIRAGSRARKRLARLHHAQHQNPGGGGRNPEKGLARRRQAARLARAGKEHSEEPPAHSRRQTRQPGNLC